MNQLYPIIRRQRRPLVVNDAPPSVVGNVEPVNAGHKDAQKAQDEGRSVKGEVRGQDGEETGALSANSRSRLQD